MTTEHNYKELVTQYKGIRAAAKAISIPYSTFWDALKREHLSTFSSRKVPEPTKINNPIEGEKTKYFILTSAQDSSKINEPFWNNLKAFSDYLSAEIYIGAYTYSKKLFEDHSKASSTFHPDLVPHMVWGQIHLGNDLIFAGEMNISPTAQKPLSGYETYTGDKGGIFPHAKVQLVSIPTAKSDRTKILMTTGSVTEPNYVQKNAGIKAIQHHVIGAVLVELADDGAFFCRHILADENGSFQDLDIKVEKGKVTTGNAVEAIVYGDIHHEKLDPAVAKATWGYNTETQTTDNSVNLLDWLKPRFQFMHDLSDFTPRSHHNIHDPHFRFMLHSQGGDNVEEALKGCAKFLEETARSFTTTVVVESNHDEALVKWLKTADFKADPENSIFYLKTQLKYYEYLSKGISSPPIFEDVLRENADLNSFNIVFNSVDESFTVCDGMIECGSHGHLGANGARPSPLQYTKQGKKTCSGHTHTASILDGAYTAGVSGKMDMGYNRGNSSWSQSHIIVYPSGRRAIVTMNNNRFFA